MKLFESPDFTDLIQATQNHFGHNGLTEMLVEKDYYVTEALRIIAYQYPQQVIFKGGTSLSKAWNLIQRFSEDIDLFLNKKAFDPPLGESKADKTLKTLENIVASHPAFTLDRERKASKRGVYRHSYFHYPQQFPSLGLVSNRIFLEVGTRSGTYPVEKCEISSYISQFLKAKGESLNAEDEASFTMSVLHYRRTFVEKLFAIHSAVMDFQNQQKALGSQVRHYYDLYCLAQTDEITQLLTSDEYQSIKLDVYEISKLSFPQQIDLLPEALDFSKSVALFPELDLAKEIAKEYKTQCQSLCYGIFPKWQEIQECFAEIRAYL
jgi:predicted nucleotidyltransferase component of viral defense system